MNKGMMWGFVVVALIVGVLIGYSIEKQRATSNMEATKMAMQKQIDETKAMVEKDKMMEGKTGDAMMKKEDFMGVTMKEGKIMTIWKGGSFDVMKEDVTLDDGTKVMTDGTVIRKDGSRTTLQEGESLEVNGAMMKK